MDKTVIIGYDVVGEPLSGQLCYFSGYDKAGNTLAFTSDGVTLVWRFNTKIRDLSLLREVEKEMLKISNLG